MEQPKKKKSGSWIGIVIAVAVLMSERVSAVLVIVLIGLIIYGFSKAKQPTQTGREKTQRFDDCPKPICFHKDKGEHHVARGKEIDPWDRPDIDISKYQRK